MDFSPTKSAVPDERKYRIRLLGANGATPTAELGAGVTVTRTGEGAYLITWASNPGTFLGWSPGFGAATPADLAGYTVVRDTYDSATYSMAFVVYNSTFAAADIIAAQYLDIAVEFSTNGQAR